MYRIISTSGEENAPNRLEIMVADENDLATVPACAVGSIAYTAGYAQIWQKDLDGQWVKV